MPGNTYSASLVTDCLSKVAVNVLGNQLAPLSSFSTNFGTDRFKPKAKVQAAFVTSGATAQTDPTDWESGDSVVTAKEVTVYQKSASCHVTNADLNNGLRLETLFTPTAESLADAVMDTVLAPVTTANFTTGVTSAAAAFSTSDMTALWALLKKSRTKNLLLDGEYMARIINQPGYAQPVGNGSSGWKVFGWDGVYLNTRWTGAGSNIYGFACGPTAIGIAAGLPEEFPSHTGLVTGTVTIPGINLQVSFSTWFSLKTRSYWASYDVMIGSVLLDSTAGYLVASQ